VSLSDELSSLHQRVRLFCRKELGLLNTDYKDLRFQPHLTLAFRDLRKPAFTKAWEEFKDKPYGENFLADRLCLLKHDGKNWQVLREFALGSL
jgi:2'-5' RNA ligase